MRLSKVLFLQTIILLHHPTSEAGESKSILAITNVTIVRVTDDSAQSPMTILVVGNQIQMVGASRDVSIPDIAQVVDGSDKFVIPGLWDMHVHLFNQVSGRPPNEWYFPLLLAFGITSIREMNTKPDDMIRVRQWRQTPDRIPRIALVGAMVEGTAPAWPNSYVVDNVEEARVAVHRIKAAGIDFVKVYSTLPADLYFAIAEEAKQLKIPFAGHVPIVVDAGDAAQAGQKSMEHLNELLESGCTRLAEELRLVTWHEWTDAHMELALNNYDELRCQRLFSLFIKNGTVHIPTLVNEFIKQLSAQEIEGVFQDPLFGEVPDVERQVWSQAAILRTKLSPTSLALRKRAFQAKLRLVRAMHDAGVTLMAGTDLGNEFLYPGSSLIEELELFVQAGLTPMEAIKAATITPATFAHMADSLGSITPGKLADLVVLDADPLQNISNLRRVHCVVLNGKIVQKGENKR